MKIQITGKTGFIGLYLADRSLVTNQLQWRSAKKFNWYMVVGF